MKFDLTSVFDILRASGHRPVAFNGEKLVLYRSDMGERTFRFHLVRRLDERGLPPEPIRADPRYASLFVVPRSTDALRRAADEGRLAFVAVRDGSCMIAGREWPETTSGIQSNFTLYALARYLMATSIPIHQGRSVAETLRPRKPAPPTLSSMLGISQSHVSVLMKLLPDGAVEQTARAGCVVRDFDALWEWHLSTYSGPGDVRLAWHSPHGRHTQLDNLRRTAGTAALKLGGTRRDAQILLSGLEAVPTPILDPRLGPAEAAREPNRRDSWGPVTLFSRSYTEALTDMRYTPCDPSDATAQLVLPADLTIYDTAAAWGDESRTDPVITAWELAQGPEYTKVQIQALLNWAKRYASKH